MARKNFRATGGIDIDTSAIPTSIIQETITSNSATTVDTIALNSFLAAEYTVTLTQGSKIRTSKVIMQTDGSSVDMTEFAITETGGTMSGVTVSATTASTNAVLQITVTDAASTLVRYKLVRNITTLVGYAPDAPTIGTATAGMESATVTFTAPADTGNSAITSYTVTSNPGNITGSGASSPITISGLTAGTSYTFTVTATNVNGTSAASSASNSISPTAPLTADILVVAGAGGGGHMGGGGGAGGLLVFQSQSITSGTYTVTVGGGGAGAPGGSAGPRGTNGSNSSFGALTAAVGGGGGAKSQGTVSISHGLNGGSGGGAAADFLDSNINMGFGFGTAGQGFDGGGSHGSGTQTAPAGLSSGNGSNTSCGGGGASEKGYRYFARATGDRVGGNGLTSALINAMGAATSTGQLSGGNYYYAGGGGAGSGGTGGLGGGGNGGNSSVDAGSGTANTGGGGAASSGNINRLSGSGGSGIVILRTQDFQPTATHTGTLFTTGGYKYYRFTSSGSITF